MLNCLVGSFLILTAHEAQLVPALAHGHLLLGEVHILGAARADSGHLAEYLFWSSSSRIHKWKLEKKTIKEHQNIIMIRRMLSGWEFQKKYNDARSIRSRTLNVVQMVLFLGNFIFYVGTAVYDITVCVMFLLPYNFFKVRIPDSTYVVLNRMRLSDQSFLFHVYPMLVSYIGYTVIENYFQVVAQYYVQAHTNSTPKFILNL